MGVVVALLGSVLAAEPTRGFERDGVGLELGGFVGFHSASGVNEGHEPTGTEFSGTVRLRLGRHFGVGVTYESVSVIIGQGGDADYLYSRQQLALDVQWRFLDEGVLRPWLAAGMAWGSLARNQGFCQDCSVSGSFVWEYLRLQAGLDFVFARSFAVGPALRVGLARWDAPEGARTVTTVVAGLRVTVALP